MRDGSKFTEYVSDGNIYHKKLHDASLLLILVSKGISIFREKKVHHVLTVPL